MQQEPTHNPTYLHASYASIYDPVYDVAYGVGFVFYDEEQPQEALETSGVDSTINNIN